MSEQATPEAVLEVAKLIAGTFIERRDAKAVQSSKGAYMPVREDMRDTDSNLIGWRLSDVVDHVEGRETYGHYVVSTEGACRVIVFDIDLRAKANPLRDETPIMFDGEEIDPREVWSGGDTPAKRKLAMDLRVMTESFARRCHRILGVKVLASYSGCKGMHVYACLDPGTQASEAREGATLVIDSMDGLIVPDHGKNFFKHESAFTTLSIELFPKQTEVGADGFGNLVRLPLGVNKKSGGRGFFIDLNTPQDKFRVDDPALALKEGSIRG